MSADDVRRQVKELMEDYRKRPSDANKAVSSVLALVDAAREEGYRQGVSEMADRVKEDMANIDVHHHWHVDQALAELQGKEGNGPT